MIGGSSWISTPGKLLVKATARNGINGSFGHIPILGLCTGARRTQALLVRVNRLLKVLRLKFRFVGQPTLTPLSPLLIPIPCLLPCVLGDIDAYELEMWRFTNSPANFVDNDHEVLEVLVSEAFSNMGVKKLFTRQVIAGLNISAGEVLLVKFPDPPVLELYCLIRGDGANHIFPAKIASTESVGTLKEIVREKNKFALEHMDAKTLTLWKVSIPVDDSLKEEGDRVAEACKAWGSSVSQEAPSSGGLPKKFVAIQKKDKPAFAFNRPPTTAVMIPISLYHPISSQFQDDCKTYTPTKEDHDFALKFSHSMSNIYANEGDRADQARKDFASYGLDLLPTGIGKYWTDGDLRYKGFCFALIEAKAELSTGGAEPFFEAAWYYSAFIRNHFDETRSRLPCFILYLAGAHIGFSGSVLTIHPHLEVLAPNHYESEPPHITSDPILMFPYPTNFDSLRGTTKYAFEYSSQLDEKRLLFSGTVGDEKIFTHRYSEDAHLACFSLGCAPALKWYQPIAGGWYMVVMALIGDDYHELRHSEMKALFKAEIEEKVNKKHLCMVIFEPPMSWCGKMSTLTGQAKLRKCDIQ
ncbi:uncharacterized protein EI90DRAFT_3019264 [Cantharellus anzutake]|uniref:uncharacterized protein n=1 Tax=Cantharellus anzutake TaxID=1750568 RepID=UPI00190316DE|nr:uncharacterized protein EI90DRAFT_3019264 [Cantharellus anzutake]KAF8325081.1 hypothetical protein EI90DRAFT_3019264 [Cantharellus anzutake]